MSSDELVFRVQGTRLQKMPTKSNGKKGKAVKGSVPQEQIVFKFNQLRQEQRNLIAKINELEMDHSEHNMVIENLNGVAPDRKCFRLVGGVLVERTVKDVLPALATHRDQIKLLISKLKSQWQAKCDEVNKFKEEHNIKVQGEKNPAAEQGQSKEEKTTGVLVAKPEK